MDEDINIIDTNTRNEKIKNFLLKYKKLIISLLVIIILIIIFVLGLSEYKNQKRKNISDLYNSTIIEYSKDTKEKTIKTLIEIINKKDTTYSPLSLYFIIDKNLTSNRKEINNLFNILIEKTSLNIEIKNLIIYKKGLYNADQIDENELINILSPVINSESVWKSHALYLLAEYFYSKNEKQKSKEFFNQIIILKNSNQDILKEAQKRLNRDLSE